MRLRNLGRRKRSLSDPGMERAQGSGPYATGILMHWVRSFKFPGSPLPTVGTCGLVQAWRLLASPFWSHQTDMWCPSGAASREVEPVMSLPSDPLPPNNRGKWLSKVLHPPCQDCLLPGSWTRERLVICTDVTSGQPPTSCAMILPAQAGDSCQHAPPWDTRYCAHLVRYSFGSQVPSRGR